jgi:hypothetical protein
MIGKCWSLDGSNAAVAAGGFAQAPVVRSAFRIRSSDVAVGTDGWFSEGNPEFVAKYTHKSILYAIVIFLLVISGLRNGDPF